jgi:uncharacterized protein (TIGR02271 family)
MKSPTLVTRIPIREERIEIKKIPVAIAEVSVFKEKVSTNEVVKEQLKTEVVRVDEIGNPDVKQEPSVTLP